MGFCHHHLRLGPCLVPDILAPCHLQVDGVDEVYGVLGYVDADR